ncbi:MAG: outer membrane beta-barrel protein [candidate division KSB1 bacterium]|nr:outer membrane beta-barrel protein [candidate division KSB1 bacterium]
MWKKMLLLMGLITALVVPVNAQSVSLGPQVGYYKAQDADANFMGGVAWRFKFTPMLGLEASINYRQEKYANDALTVRSWPIMVSGLIYPTPLAYGAIGAGWYNTTMDYDQEKFSFLKDETTQEFGWHFGGGTELPVGSNLKLTGDIRYVFLDYDFKEIPGSSNLESNFYVITIGLLFGL